MGALITAVITAIITFVLTGLVGNFLVQKWQQRNWINQHRLLGAEKQFKELQNIFDEIMSLGDARNYRVRRLVRHKLSEEQALERLRHDYDESVVRWNDRFNSLCVRLTMYAGYTRYTEVLEGDIQPAFVAIGERLDIAVSHLVAKEAIPRALKHELESRLNEMSGKLFSFSRGLLRVLLTKQKEAYEGEKILFSEKNLVLFSRWYLFKALFKTSHASQAVGSSALDFHPPFFFRPEWTRVN